jgi:anti-sigma factor RsiW
MNEEHIIDLLGDASPSGLSDEHRSRVEGHVVHCPDCRRAYTAARGAATLLRARAAQEIEVPPFFATRVMAALREQQSKPLLFAPASWWQTTKAFLFSGAAMAALLGALIVVTPESPTPNQRVESDAPESVVFTEDTQTVESPSNADAIDVVFRPEDADAGNQR